MPTFLNQLPLGPTGGQLPSSIGTLFTCSTRCRLDPIVIVNTDTVNRTFNLYVKRIVDTASRRITPKDLLLVASAAYESAPLSLETGDLVQGDASAAAVLDYTINGLIYPA